MAARPTIVLCSIPNYCRSWSAPKPGVPLRAADAALLARLNQAVAQGRLANRAGRTVGRPLEAALVRADGAVLYPIVDDIPVLLIDEGILLPPPAEPSDD